MPSLPPRAAAHVGSPEAIATREALRSYLRKIIDVEWPSMARGEESAETSP